MTGELLEGAKGADVTSTGRYGKRVAMAVARMNSVLPQLYQSIGFGGLHACVLLLAAAVGDTPMALEASARWSEYLESAEELAKGPGAINTRIVHSLLCPNFEGDQDEAATWRLGSLHMGCGLRQGFPLRDLTEVRPDGTKVLFLSQSPPLRAASSVPYTGHTWGCRYGATKRFEPWPVKLSRLSGAVRHCQGDCQASIKASVKIHCQHCQASVKPLSSDLDRVRVVLLPRAYSVLGLPRDTTETHVGHHDPEAALSVRR